MALRETELRAIARACTLCGYRDVHDYHFMADHLHKGAHGSDPTIDIEMNHICKCGQCCSCFEWEEKLSRTTTPVFDVRYGQYFQSLCRSCTTMPIRPTVIYRYCLICVCSKTCPVCRVPSTSLLKTRFCDYQSVTVTCTCGNMFMPKDSVLPSVDIVHDHQDDGDEDSQADCSDTGAPTDAFN